MTNPCKHSALQVMGFNALGVTVGCIMCDETFDLPAALMDEKYYHFIHHSPQGPKKDIDLLIHERIIERE